MVNKEIDASWIENEKKICKKNPEHFIDNYIFVKNKFDDFDSMPQILKDRVIGDKIQFVMYDIQRKLVKAIFEKDHIISTKSRQIGFTTTSLACSLWLLTFKNTKTILLFSKSEKDAKATLNEMKFMYDNLPFFLRRKVYKRNEKELSIGTKLNASTMLVQTSGKSSGRSHSATWLITDEADFIQGIEDIYRAALPAISATKGKMIVLSTPNLWGSWFHGMVKGAESGENGFTLIPGEWWRIPYRDKKWYDDQCKMLNHDKRAISTELNMKWILPFDTYFSEKKLEEIKQIKEQEIIVGCVKKYDTKTKTDEYLISIDCQEEGADYNAITVFNLKTGKLEATLKTRMNVFETSVELSKFYNDAKIIIERNRGFYLIKKFEENNLEHLLLPNIKYIPRLDRYELDIDKDGNPIKLGFVTTKQTRGKLLLHLSEFFYKSKVLPVDLMDEAEKFIIKRGKPMGLEHDDLLMSTGIGLLTMHVLKESKEQKNGSKKLSAFFKTNYKHWNDRQSVKAQKHKEKIEGEISNLLRATQGMFNGDLEVLAELEMLENIKSGTKTKIQSAMMNMFG